jgi:hypothetical protein
MALKRPRGHRDELSCLARGRAVPLIERPQILCQLNAMDRGTDWKSDVEYALAITVTTSSNIWIDQSVRNAYSEETWRTPRRTLSWDGDMSDHVI